MNQTLVSWNHPGQQGLSQALISADFTSITGNPISSLPLFMGTFEDTAANKAFRLSFSVIDGTYHSSYAAFTIANLSVDEQERLSWFTDRLAEVEQAMLDAIANSQISNGVPSNGAGNGVGEFYRVVEVYQDTDGDGILDHHEQQIGTDPWETDSDHDGYSDLVEINAGSDPTESNSDPTNSGGSGPYGSDLPPHGNKDEDTLRNALDADPLDPKIDWERRPLPRFLMLEVAESFEKFPTGVNNLGYVIMNKGSESESEAFYWKPGLSKAEKLSDQGLTVDVHKFSGWNGSEKVFTDHTLTLEGVSANDINSVGEIVGTGFFYENAPPSGGSGSSGTPPAPDLKAAIRWDTVTSTPELVHPGKVAITDWGEMLLNSEATQTNEPGTIIGYADFHFPASSGEPPYASWNVPCLWEKATTETLGLELYPVFEGSEDPDPYPSIGRLYSNEQILTGSFGTDAAIWESWTVNPFQIMQNAGSASRTVSLLPERPSPNERLQGAVALTRLFVREHSPESWEPTLRTFDSGDWLTEDGTIWTNDNNLSLRKPLEVEALSSLLASQGTVDSLADVTDQGFAVAQNTGGVSALLVPVGFKVYSDSVAGPDKAHFRNLSHISNSKYTDEWNKCVARVWSEADEVNLIDYLDGADDPDTRAIFEANLEWKIDGSPQSLHVLTYGDEPADERHTCIKIEVLSKHGGGTLDRLLLTIVPRSTTQFLSWVSDNSDLTWLNELPRMYSSIMPETGGSFPDPEGSCPDDKWGDPDTLSSLYHPGSPYEIRSKETAGGYGHQTCYDENYMLIKAGVSAGSADKKYPLSWPFTGSNSHGQVDVKPFIWAAQLDGNPVDGTTARANLDTPMLYEGHFLREYLRVRPVLGNPNSTELSFGNCP
jgi:hypothetical protein